MKVLKHILILIIAILVSVTIMCVFAYVSKVVHIDFKAENPPNGEFQNAPPVQDHPFGERPIEPPPEEDRPDKRFTNESEPGEGKNISEWAVKKVETTYEVEKFMGKSLTRQDGMEILAYIYMRVHWNFGDNIENIAKDIRHSVKNNMGYDDYDNSGNINRIEFFRAVQYIFDDDYKRAEAEMDASAEDSMYTPFSDVSDAEVQHDLNVMRKLAWIEGCPGNVIKLTGDAKYDDLKVIENCLKSPAHQKVPLLNRILALILSVIDKASILAIALFFVGELLHLNTNRSKTQRIATGNTVPNRRRRTTMESETIHRTDSSRR